MQEESVQNKSFEKYKKHRKVHFYFNDSKNKGVTFCGVHNSTSIFVTTEDWEQVTCGNCIAAKYTAIRNFKPIEMEKV